MLSGAQIDGGARPPDDRRKRLKIAGAGTGVNGGQAEYDLLVIGGGINGCGIARDAAGRGYKVALVEKDDLASGTSSKSTKLVHGGLRYLESLRIRMVREALAERETLWRIAPHLVQPLRFVVPVLPGARPAWLLRLGLFLYDHLGAREKLPGASSLDLRRAPEGAPLKPQLVKAFAYSDCRVDDSRLVVLNARDAADRGAAIFTRTTFLRAQASDGVWRAVAARRGHRRGTGPFRAVRGQRRRAVGRPGSCRRRGAGQASAPAAGARQPYRRAEIVRS